MAIPSDFFTRERANHGVRVMLPGPDRQPTDQWLHILHTDSDAYRAGVSLTMQKIAELAAERDEAKRKAKQADLEFEAIAALVSDWSFDAPFSREGVIELLREAPYIKDLIDRKAADNALFFGKGSASSSSTQSPAQG